MIKSNSGVELPANKEEKLIRNRVLLFVEFWGAYLRDDFSPDLGSNRRYKAGSDPNRIPFYRNLDGPRRDYKTASSGRRLQLGRCSCAATEEVRRSVIRHFEPYRCNDRSVIEKKKKHKRLHISWVAFARNFATDRRHLLDTHCRP